MSHLTYYHEFDEEIDKILDDKDLNLGNGKRRYYLYKMVSDLKHELLLRVSEP